MCSKQYHWQQETTIAEHIRVAHKATMAEAETWISNWVDSGPDSELARRKWRYSFYCAAVMHNERQHMPLIGPTKDRQMLARVAQLYNSKTVQSRMCFCCDQIYTDVRSFWHQWTYKGAEKW